MAYDASEYLLQETIVLDDLRLAYVPVPKAGSTAILWSLASLGGLRPEDFRRSRKLEVTRALTVHDLSVWGPSRRLVGRSAAEAEEVLRSDEWFRFTIVRDPVRRLWSGWVSKMLFRNPRFAGLFGDGPPGASSQDVLDEFRAFVRVLPDRPDLHDRHWAAQAELVAIDDVDYAHVGRVERLDATVATLARHLGARNVELPALRRENPSFVPFSPSLFDDGALAACLAWTARDRDAFGYPAPASAGEPDAEWHAQVEAALPAIHAIVEQNERIADLRGMVEELTPDASDAPRRARAVGLVPESWRRRLGGRAHGDL